MRAIPPRLLLAGAGAGAVLLAGCSGGPAPDAVPTPTGTAGPWDQRPVVRLSFDVADDLSSVSGREQIVFTPDERVCELVFRNWPNKPTTARPGSGLVVTEVQVDGEVVDARDEEAGAPAAAPAGTLLRVPLAQCVDAGATVTADLRFDLQLGVDVDERIGRSSRGDAAWFATAFPLLAWERGVGWDETPAVAVAGETAVSEEFRLESLQVTAPSEYVVQGTGSLEDRTADPGDPDRTTTEFSAPSVRDVAVYVGDYEVREFDVEGVRVHFAGVEGRVEAPLDDWEEVIEASLEDLVDLLGPFPYDDLWITVVESDSSGIEFPGAVQVADVDPERRRPLITHELAHTWFYSLVGNDQGRDPWLDEAFATFAQRVADGDDVSLDDLPRRTLTDVGRPLSWFTRYRSPATTFYERVYTAGGTALVEARDRVGAEEFDAALQRYLRENAHTIATPEDVAEAFAELPEVLEVLVDVGALPEADDPRAAP
ncbi:M1 family aminopeptidase [Kineococcus arenarius]|uniref:M1 family aminopeptidase n=1 Tax=unclassified Kineococcus TaxID=2621656 RepID=UPI003D7E8200